MPSPTRDTSERDLHQFNLQLRQQPFVQAWLRQRGKVDTGRGIQLNDMEREQFVQMLRANGVQIPDGMKVDGAGNFNQKNHLLRNIGIGAAVGGAALTGLGAAGIGPMSGLFGSGAAAAGGAGGVLPSSSLPAASLMGGPAAITSQGASAALGGLLPASHLGGAALNAASGIGPLAANDTSYAAAAIGGPPARVGSQGVSQAGRAAGGGVGNALAGAGRTALQNLATPQGMLSLAPIIASLANRGGNDGGMGGDSNAFLQQAYGDAKERNAKAMARYDRTDPLHRMVTQLAEDRMPISSRRGIK